MEVLLSLPSLPANPTLVGVLAFFGIAIGCVVVSLVWVGVSKWFDV